MLSAAGHAALFAFLPRHCVGAHRVLPSPLPRRRGACPPAATLARGLGSPPLRRRMAWALAGAEGGRHMLTGSYAP